MRVEDGVQRLVLGMLEWLGGGLGREALGQILERVARLVAVVEKPLEPVAARERVRAEVPMRLPPILSDLLLPCFNDLSSRPSADDVRDRFASAVAMVPMTADTEERWAWRRWDVLRSMAASTTDPSAIESELRGLATQHGAYVPATNP